MTIFTRFFTLIAALTITLHFSTGALGQEQEAPQEPVTPTEISPDDIQLPRVVAPMIQANKRPGPTIPAMRKYMSEFVDEYIPLYMENFFQLNPRLSRDWYPSIEALIQRNKGTLKNLPNSQVPNFLRNGGLFQQFEMDAMVYSHTALGQISENKKKFEGFGKRIAEIENQVSGKPIAPENSRTNESDPKFKSEITRLETQIRQLKIDLAEKVSSTPTALPTAKSPTSWISIAALILALLALFKRRKNA